MTPTEPTTTPKGSIPMTHPTELTGEQPPMDELERARERVRAAAAEPGKVIASIYPEKVGHYHCHVRVADLTTLDTALTEALTERDRYRHAANEWADMATSGIQWLRNIRAGISTPEAALANMDECLEHCQKVAHQALSKSPTTPAEGDET